MAALAVASLAASGAGGPGDPVAVFLPAEACRSGLLEMQVWSREAEAWQPHPEHPRVLANACQVETAGDLLNETRFRCVAVPDEPVPHPWRRVQVFSPAWMQRCELPVPPPASLRIRVETPVPGDVVSNLERRVSLSGRIERVGEGASRGPGARQIFWLQDRSPAVRESGASARERLLAALRERGQPADARVVGFASHEPGSPARPRDLAAALETVRGRLAAGPDGATPAVAPVVVVWGDAGPGDPFGRAMGSRPHERARLVGLARELAEGGALLEIVGRGRGAPPEVVRDMHAAAPGGVSWQPRSTPAAALAAWLADELAPTPSRVRVENLDLGKAAHGVEIDPAGRFSAQVPLKEGPNRLRVVAEVASGATGERELDIVFDSSRPRAEWLRAERARIEALRAQRGEVKVEPDPEPPAP